MGDKTGIQWTDVTWNPTRGCSRVSEGCSHCYAERVAMRFSGEAMPYEGLAQLRGGRPGWTGKVRLVRDMLREPLHWRKPQRVFVNSMSDLFHESLKDEEIEEVFAVMALATQHTFQVLTKRPERMLAWFATRGELETRAEAVARAAAHRGRVVFDSRGSQAHLYPLPVPREALSKRRPWPGWPLPNVWLGVSVENQTTADERIPLLLKTPAAVRFISAEPLLDEVDLTRYLSHKHRPAIAGHCIDIDNYTWHKPDERCLFCGHGEPLLDWIICGGESGPGARRFELQWARTILRDCRAAGVPCFIKQLGACASDPENGMAGRSLRVPPDVAALISRRLVDRSGGDMAEWPEELRVREFPRASAPSPTRPARGAQPKELSQ